jgi:hypothetical protein
MRRDLHIQTRGGVEDLGRVVGVLALLGITPLALQASRDASGLAIDVQLQGDRRDLDLCLARLRALVSVTSAAPAATRAAPMARPGPCATASH